MTILRSDIILRFGALGFKTLMTVFAPLYIGIELYGEVSFLTATSFQLSLLVGSGFAVVLTRERAQEKIQNKSFLATGLFLDLTIFFACVSFLFVFNVLEKNYLYFFLSLMTLTEIINTVLLRCNVSSGDTKLSNIHTSIRFISWPLVLVLVYTNFDTLLLTKFSYLVVVLNILTAIFIIKKTKIEVGPFVYSDISKLLFSQKYIITQYYILYGLDLGFTIFLRSYLLLSLEANEFGQLMYCLAVLSIYDSVIDMMNAEFYKKIMNKVPLKIKSLFLSVGMIGIALFAIIAWYWIIGKVSYLDNIDKITVMAILFFTMIIKYFSFEAYLSVQSNRRDNTILFAELSSFIFAIASMFIIGTGSIISALFIFIIQQNSRNLSMIYLHVKSS